jgi:hypothetical protein
VGDSLLQSSDLVLVGYHVHLSVGTQRGEPFRVGLSGVGDTVNEAQKCKDCIRIVVVELDVLGCRLLLFKSVWRTSLW